MRFARVLFTDMRYQFKYGFYFLYALVSMVYAAILLLIPEAVRREAAAVIIWSDPAALGFFFIGGMVLLEKGEGLHSYLSITPVTTRDYVAAKALSLSIIATLAGVAVAALGLGGRVNYPLLAAALLAGAAIFTLFGLIVGVAARSVNHYLVLGIPAGIVLMGSSVAYLLGVNHPLLAAFPATLLLRLLSGAVGLAMPGSAAAAAAGLVLWLLPAFWLANKSFASYLRKTGVL
ncbi:MAG: ABC transporter [Bacillota bacterium]